MTNLQTIIHLLRDSDRPASHAKLMDDAARILSRIPKAIDELTSQIDGGEEMRGRDSNISEMIRILEGGSMSQELMSAIEDIRIAMLLPSVLYHPILRTWSDEVNGEYWLAKYWDVEGKGASPQEAMADFDRLWNEKLKSPQKKASQEINEANLPLFSEGHAE